MLGMFIVWYFLFGAYAAGAVNHIEPVQTTVLLMVFEAIFTMWFWPFFMVHSLWRYWMTR